MGERVRHTEEMATTSTAPTVATVQPPLEEVEQEVPTVITLRKTRPRNAKKVVWTEDTVDNEDMNKKKSKCCCIYSKPHKFGESDSEDSDDECESCFGHVERRTKTHEHPGTSTEVQQKNPEHEAALLLTLHEEPTPAPAPPDEEPKKPDS